MDQKQRNKIALILSMILAPIFIYTLSTNVFKAAKRPISPSSLTSPSPPPPPPAPIAMDVVGAVSPVATSSRLDMVPNVAAEQQKIAARLPRRNPFSVAEAERQTTDDKQQITEVGRLTVNNETKLKVTAIVSRQGSNKRIAMINGKMLEEGDRIGEWTIHKVNPKNVVLSNGALQMVVGVK